MTDIIVASLVLVALLCIFDKSCSRISCRTNPEPSKAPKRPPRARKQL